MNKINLINKVVDGEHISPVLPEDIKNYFESSPTPGTYDEDRSDSELDYTGVLLEAEEILTLEEMRKLFI